MLTTDGTCYYCNRFWLFVLFCFFLFKYFPLVRSDISGQNNDDLKEKRNEER